MTKACHRRTDEKLTFTITVPSMRSGYESRRLEYRLWLFNLGNNWWTGDPRYWIIKGMIDY